MTWQIRTHYFLIVNLAITLLYDFIAWRKGGNPATISYWFWHLDKPSIIVGVFLGHCLWQVANWNK